MSWFHSISLTPIGIFFEQLGASGDSKTWKQSTHVHKLDILSFLSKSKYFYPHPYSPCNVAVSSAEVKQNINLPLGFPLTFSSSLSCGRPLQWLLRRLATGWTLQLRLHHWWSLRWPVSVWLYSIRGPWSFLIILPNYWLGSQLIICVATKTCLHPQEK